MMAGRGGLNRWMLVALLAGGTLFMVFAAPARGASALTGEQAFSLCRGCHSLNETGPHSRIASPLDDIMGKAAGAQPGYSFSPALQDSGIVWSQATLHAWIIDSERLVPGSWMLFDNVLTAQEVTNLIDYMVQPPPPEPTMKTASIVLLTLVAYQVLLVMIGLWASRRTRSKADFFIGGRSLGPMVAAISYSSSASSAWTLLGISGIAYVMGVGALWVATGSVLGMLVAWFWVAPRLMRQSREQQLVTLTDLLLKGMEGPLRRALLWLVSLIIVVSFSFYVAAQFQGAAGAFASTFGLSVPVSILTGAAIIMIYTLLGGFWAVSVTDTVQGLLMAVCALLLPVFALQALGGWDGFVDGLAATDNYRRLDWRAGHVGLAGAGFVLGFISIGIGTFGQPHLLVRFMALRDENTLRQARLLTIAWYLLVFMSMCFLGLAGHILFPVIDDPETVLFALSESLLPPLVGGILVAAVLSAIMSTADSQLLVAASALAHDLGLGRGSERRTLLVSRLSVVALVVVAVAIAYFLPERIFSRVLFAWIALGSAFGPLVFARLAGWQLRPDATLASVCAGFGSAVALYLAPDTPGDIAERALPFILASLCLWLGRRRKSVP